MKHKKEYRAEDETYILQSLGGTMIAHAQKEFRAAKREEEAKQVDSWLQEDLIRGSSRGPLNVMWEVMKYCRRNV